MDVKRFYEEIGGNYQNALALMMNDALIARMLGKFMAANSVGQIISRYAEKDYRGVFTGAHALKGVAGNLALTPLYELASALTEATRNADGANLDGDIAKLRRSYELIPEKYQAYIL